MDFEPQKLEALLALLLESGVEEFECKDFHVRFASTALVPAPAGDVVTSDTGTTRLPSRAAVSGPGLGLWDNPSLWPSGAPPGFPGKEDK